MANGHQHLLEAILVHYNIELVLVGNTYVERPLAWLRIHALPLFQVCSRTADDLYTGKTV